MVRLRTSPTGQGAAVRPFSATSARSAPQTSASCPTGLMAVLIALRRSRSWDAAQPTAITDLQPARARRLSAWRVFREASAVTAQVLTTPMSGHSPRRAARNPSDSSSSRICCDSYWLTLQPSVVSRYFSAMPGNVPARRCGRKACRPPPAKWDALPERSGSDARAIRRSNRWRAQNRFGGSTWADAP